MTDGNSHRARGTPLRERLRVYGLRSECFLDASDAPLESPMQRKVDVEGSEMKVQRWTASKRRIERLGRTAIRLLTPDKGDSSAGRALRNANFLPPMRGQQAHTPGKKRERRGSVDCAALPMHTPRSQSAVGGQSAFFSIQPGGTPHPTAPNRPQQPPLQLAMSPAAALPDSAGVALVHRRQPWRPTTSTATFRERASQEKIVEAHQGCPGFGPGSRRRDARRTSVREERAISHLHIDRCSDKDQRIGRSWLSVCLQECVRPLRVSMHRMPFRPAR